MNASILPHGFHFIERGWLSSNSLLVQDAEHATLFDTGYVTHSSQLLYLVKRKLASQPLDLIVNSHLHSDHCGGNALLQSIYPDADVQIPFSQFDQVTRWNESALTYQASGQTCQPFSPSLGLHHGETLTTSRFEWQILAAPGHDNDAFIFFQPDHKILISADALWEHGLGVIFPEFLGGIGFENVSKTLDLIESLKPELVLPGHGSSFTDYSSAISSSRKRLDVFSNEPQVHATYSSKVLLKFFLLEKQHVPLNDFLDWCLNNPMLILIHTRYFVNSDLLEWIQELIEELVLRKAAVVEAGLIKNI